MDVYEAISGRRSIRKYQPTKVEEKKLLKLTQAAIMAPNGGNAQPWDFVFVTDVDLIKQLCYLLESVHQEYFGKARKDALLDERLQRAASFYRRMENAPAFVLACLNDRNPQLNKPYEQWTLQWAHHSIAAAMENLMLAAVAEGLGTCWLGTPSWRTEEIKSLFHIPDNVEVVAVSPIGYPDEAPKARPRMPLTEVTHFNAW